MAKTTRIRKKHVEPHRSVYYAVFLSLFLHFFGVLGSVWELLTALLRIV